jgi:general secretion pathway protein F
MNAREVGAFTQQLSTLLGAGLPLDRSLQVLLDLAENDRVKRPWREIRDHVRRAAACPTRSKSSTAPSTACS